MTGSARSFARVDTWVFDLDNTLYPRHINLWQQVDVRIRDYVARFLKMPPDEAYAVQKELYKRYGTTMRGMMTEYGMDAHAYLDYVHDIDHSPLEPDPALGAAIAELPGRKLILTNGTRAHADAVLSRLEINPHFEDVFGIIEAEFEPKPSSQTYERFIARHGHRSFAGGDVRGSRAQPGGAAPLRHDDGAGGAGGQQRAGRQPWEMEGLDAAFVDHVTDDLTGFLTGLVDGK